MRRPTTSGRALRSLFTWAALLLGALTSTACGGGEDAALAVWDIQPRAGASTGEQTIEITGEGFRTDIGYAVYFGSARAERTTIRDSHTLLVASPSGEAGSTVDVVVVADDGPAFRIEDGFAYQDQGGNVMEQVGDHGGGGGRRF